MEWEVMPHPPYLSDTAPSNFHLFWLLEHFLCHKNLGWYPKCHLQIFCSKVDWFFIHSTLIICKLDGKKSSLTRVITLFIKNKNLLQSYLFEFYVKKRYYSPVHLILIFYFSYSIYSTVDNVNLYVVDVCKYFHQ